ncbi:Fe-S cluster assembly protein [Oleiphilus messinensis]|uniref:Fe-S cluster assembly protein n=2 Tax=Oleiphilus messinensis TaxID=141451 RepID=A0A1Y0I8I6_9GAMM|nr:Fe-S cluster assembly protein [Oleiphilus messinensis]
MENTMSVNEFIPSAGVTMTSAALNHTRKQIERTPNAIGIRIDLKQSGCSGYMYETSIVENSEPNDTVFEPGTGVRILVKADDLPMLSGMEIDYVTEGLNSTLVFRNPNATGECGCGESFSVS